MIHKRISYRRCMQEKYKKRLEFLTGLPYRPSGAYKKEKDGKSWYARYYRSQISSYLKNQSSRTVRRQPISDEDSASGLKSRYKKSYDYWWEMY